MTQVAAEVRGSVAIPEAKHRIEPTSKSRIDEALAIPLRLRGSHGKRVPGLLDDHDAAVPVVDLESVL